MANGARTALFFDVFARNKTGQTFSQIIKSTDTLRGKISAVGKLAAGAAAAGLAVFAAQGVRTFLQFDDQMTQSLAIMGEVSGPMRERMEQAARAVGTSTRFGASQAAEAYFFLASAGLDAEQSVAALPQVAKFAQAGMFDLARATDLATDAQSALGLTVEDEEQNLINLTRVTDTLVGANTLANASVDQFATSLTQKAGPAMRQANIQIEEGVATLAVFADQGIKAERAGTLYAATLEQLQRRAVQSKEEFEAMNIQVFDSEGNMRNMADIVGDLEGALSGMSLEQQKATLLQLGFNRSALDGIMALLGSSDALREYEGELQTMGGITEEVADKQLQSFAARLDLIKSRIIDAALVVGGVLVNAVFDAGETIGEMVRMFDELPGSVQIGIGALAALAAGTPIAIGAFRKVKATIDSVRLSLAAMSATARAATLSAGVIGIALAAGATILAFFANKNLEARQRVEELTESLDRQTGAITDNTRENVANRLEQEGMLETAQKLGIDLQTLTDAYLGNEDAMALVRDRTAEVIAENTELVDRGNSTREVVRGLGEDAQNLNDDLGDQVDALDQAQAGHERTSQAVGDTDAAEDELAAAAAQATSEIEDQTSAIEELISELDEMVSSVFAARDAERGYEEALDSATEAAKENGATLDINTEKGRNNQEQLDRLAESALKDAAATLEDAEAKGDLAAGHENATAKMQTARSEFIKVARQMGKSKEEANALADELGLIPGNYEANISVPGAAGADRSIQSLLNRLDNFDGRVATASARIVTSGGFGNLFAGRQHGGPVVPNQAFLVGEEGPELVTFSHRGHVTPADETRQLLSGNGGAASSSPSSSSESRMVVEFDFRNASDSQFATWFEGMVRKGRVRVS